MDPPEDFLYVIHLRVLQRPHRLLQVVALFGHISDKDLFQEFYRKQLSRRLLVSSTTDENERSLISKLKLKCGAPYTSKLEGMINDRNVSEETQKNFKEYIRKEGITPACEFTPQVLTTGFWPLFKIDTLDCPDQVASSDPRQDMLMQNVQMVKPGEETI